MAGKNTVHQKKSLSLRPLTPKEKAVLEFIENTLASSGVSPSYQEIRDHFGLASFNSVQNYLKQLTQKGYIQTPAHQKRAIQILQPSHSMQTQVRSQLSLQQTPPVSLLQARREGALSLPLLGRVAAGQPIERVEANEFIDVPAMLVKRPDSSFVLKVEGDSMIDDGIFDGDYLIVQKQATAQNGDIIVASIDSEATVKRFYFNSKQSEQPEPQVELRPANPRLKSMWYSPDRVDIKGLVIGLVRSYV